MARADHPKDAPRHRDRFAAAALLLQVFAIGGDAQRLARGGGGDYGSALSERAGREAILLRWLLPAPSFVFEAMSSLGFPLVAFENTIENA